MPTPPNPDIYHITDVGNLASIVESGCLWSDAQRIKQGFTCTNIGYSHIKARRLKKSVNASARGFLGDYVPFYFCNRSVMLYVIWRGHEDCKGKHDEVIHLVSDLNLVDGSGRPWAFTNVNASAAYGVEFFDNREQLNTIGWEAMALRNWEGYKEQRQAEFLVHDWFPWECVKKIGVHNSKIANQVLKIIGPSGHKPAVKVERSWYY